jgi:hypothetical protein
MSGYPVGEGPVPSKKGSGRKSKYPFDRLDPGMYFLVECAKEESKKVVGRLTASAHSWCRRRGMLNQFVCRTLPEGVGVFRIGNIRLPLEEPHGDHLDRQ